MRLFKPLTGGGVREEGTIAVRGVPPRVDGLERVAAVAAAMVGAYGLRLGTLEGFVGYAEQCNLRVRRSSGRDVPYGTAAE